MTILSKELQRFKIDGVDIVPQYIKATPATVSLVAQIHECFRYAPDDTYGNLMDTLAPLCLSSQRHRLIRGLIHVLESHLTFDEKTSIDPVSIREAIFTLAAALPGQSLSDPSWRGDVLRRVAEKFSIPVRTIDDIFYADLSSERRIASFDDIDDEEIIAQYNLALAKSLLMYARSLSFTIELGGGGDYVAQTLRELFRSLKFFHLLFDIRPLTPTSYQFVVDGPGAVLPQPQKYATDLASFLPTLYRFAHWRATADIVWEGKKVHWELEPDDFEPPTMRFAYRPSAESYQLSARIHEIDPHWTIDDDVPILTFGPQSIWVPDFSMHHDACGKTVHVEVIGFWRADYLNRRLHALQSAPKNLILVISDKLKMDRHALIQSPISIVSFKRTPRPQDVIAAALKC